MKKLAVYLLVLGVGLLVGAWLFGSDNGKEAVHDHAASGESTTWTCSMHPQIQQPKPGQCPICGMELISLKKGKWKK